MLATIHLLLGDGHGLPTIVLSPLITVIVLIGAGYGAVRLVIDLVLRVLRPLAMAFRGALKPMREELAEAGNPEDLSAR